MTEYFPPYNTSTKNIKVKLDLSNYVTKDDKTDILKLEYKIKENEKEASFNRGFFITKIKVILFMSARRNHLIMLIYS